MIGPLSILYSINFGIQWYRKGSSEMRSSGIYLISNKINNKIYAGSTKCFFKRYARHRISLRKGVHDNSHLQNSFNKYGIDNFDFNIIEIVLDNSKLLEREQYWLDRVTPYNLEIGYNIANIAGPSMNKGVSPTIEQRKRISDTLKLRKYPNPRKGVFLSDETKKKISDSVKLKNLKGSRLPQSRKVEITNIVTGNVERYDTMTEVKLKYRIDPSIMKKYNESRSIFRNMYKIKILNDYTLR